MPMSVRPRVGTLRRAGTLVPLYYETGGIHKMSINDPKWQNALRVENTLANCNVLGSNLSGMQLLALEKPACHSNCYQSNLRSRN